MSNGVLIEPLSPLISDEVQLPLQPDFSSLVNDSLSGVATPDDGFDAVLSDLVQIVDALEGGLITLGGADGGDLDDAFLEISQLDADAPGVDVANLSAAIPDVQTNVDNLGNLLTNTALPRPPAAAPAVAIASATGPILPCAARQGMGAGACGGYPCSAAVPFVNTFNQVMTIKSITLVQRAGGPFTATTDIPATLQPGEKHSFLITIAGPIAAGETAQLQIVADTPGSPYVFCVDGGTGSSGYGGGGGGGSPVLNPVP